MGKTRLWITVTECQTARHVPYGVDFFDRQSLEVPSHCALLTSLHPVSVLV